MEKIIIDIVNVISTTSLDGQINLEKIIENVPETEFNPKQFPGVVLRLQNPKVTALIFSSGKIVCTGAKSIEHAKLATESVLLILKWIGFEASNPQTQIENIVASVNYGNQVDLLGFAKALPECMYEPEQFPAALYRMTDPPATILLYKTGRLICTGLNSEEQIFRAVTQLKQFLIQKGLFL